jgi:hypothetical protein
MRETVTSRMTAYRKRQAALGLRSRQVWVLDPPQSAVDSAVRRIAANERSEVTFVERNADLSGWK